MEDRDEGRDAREAQVSTVDCMEISRHELSGSKGRFRKITPQIYTIATHEQNGADASQPEKQGKAERYI